MQCPTCNAENLDGARFCASCGGMLPTDAPAPEVDPLLGQTVGGRYKILRVLGEGGMGRVYEAERHLAGVAQRVAIKTLHPHLSQDPQIVARFHRECGTVAQLRHPNTIRVEDFGQTPDGALYIAMEFVDGKSIAKELEDKGPMSVERVERIMSQVCGSLAEAHKMGIIHRDLKPENVVLTDVGDDVDFVKVLDFGIAARKDSTDAAKEKKLTQQGMVLGTPPYMSPEQFMGKELTLRSDVYSLGIMAYEMLTGTLPFEGNTPWEWATQHMTAQPRPFDNPPSMSGLPPKTKNAILHALEKNAEKRPATAREFFEELSTGAASMRSGAFSGQVASPHVSPFGATQAATPYGAPLVSASIPRTELAAPYDAPVVAGPTQPSAQAPSPNAAPPQTGGYAMSGPAGGVPNYATPEATRTSNNKGLLIGLGALVGVGAVVAAVVAITGGRPSAGKDAPVVALPSESSSAGTTKLMPLDPLTGAGGAAAVVTTPTPMTKPHEASAPSTAGAATTKLTGDDACNASKAASAGYDMDHAYAELRACSGPNQPGTQAAFRNDLPAAADRAGNTGDCAKVKRYATYAASVGASISASKYPKCAGK